MNRCQHFNNIIKKMGNMAGGGNLPKAYKQVEWLQSDSNQYFDSGVSISSRLETRIKAQMTVYKYYGMTAGGRNNGATNGRYIVLSVADGNTLRATYGSYNNDLTIDARNVNECIYNDSAHRMYINGSLIANFSGATFDNSNPLNCYIFGGSGYNSPTEYALGARVYYVRLYDNTTAELLRDFVPCFRKSDNKPGMYDLVTNTFFTNSGTGEFVLGPNV